MSETLAELSPELMLDRESIEVARPLRFRRRHAPA
jgi:hypothetical protein